MADPVAMVTGAGRGIGRAVAIELARRGYRLSLVSRSAGELEQTAKLCGGGEVHVGDVGDPARVDQIVEQVLAKLGRVDALANCAGAVFMRSIEELTLDEWR
jgi:NAD(P)-dependent dehydrogenase (short-subunit alcohol dehydrogenase family)